MRSSLLAVRMDLNYQQRLLQHLQVLMAYEPTWQGSGVEASRQGGINQRVWMGASSFMR
jgi:hypothetical protein